MIKFSFMRALDDTCGTLLCYILGSIDFLRRRLFRIKPQVERDRVKTILCQKYFGMGSIINAIPLIKALRENFPNARIIFLTLESNKYAVRLCGIVDEVRTISFDSFGAFLKDFFALIFYLRRKKIDISIDLEFFSKFTMIVSFFTFAKIHVGLHQRGIRPEGIITHPIYYNSYRHISRIYFAYATALGIRHKHSYFESLLPSFDCAFSERIYDKLSLERKYPIIVVNVNSSRLFHFRCWPAEHFSALITKLQKEFSSFNYIFIGDKSDSTYVERVFEKTDCRKKLINAAGKTNIEELFALVKMSYLVITNDSGPMHIASAYGVNLVAFFGPETPIVYGPLNKNALLFYSEDLYCSPCLCVYDSKKSLYTEECNKNVCLSRFEPARVYETIKSRFLNSVSSTHGK